MTESRQRVRFVILHHDGIELPHFDVMFETARESLLTTFRSPRWPIEAPTMLLRIGDHRRIYLEFEGALSNDRGRVHRIASGLCSIDRHDGDSFWTICFDDHTVLNLRQTDGDQWLAVPSCGG